MKTFVITYVVIASIFFIVLWYVNLKVEDEMNKLSLIPEKSGLNLYGILLCSILFPVMILAFIVTFVYEMNKPK